MFRIHPARLHQSVTVHVARTLTACVLLLASVAALCSPSVVAAQDSSSSTYIVVPGDTLGAIATRLGVPLEALIAANVWPRPIRAVYIWDALLTAAALPAGGQR